MGPAEVMDISTVERDTGISKEKLRIWESRYGFPQPARDASGNRVYAPEQVEKLRIVRRLMDTGSRPGKIIGRTLDDLRQLGLEKATAKRLPQEIEDEISAVLESIKRRDIAALKARLGWQLARLGIRRFVTEQVAVLNEAVGDAWAKGELSVAAEHLYSEQIEFVLRTATAQIRIEPDEPKVLLTTLPGEQHKIGLLMLEAILTVERAECIPLGTQTPISWIVEAAAASKVDIVALSFSSAYPKKAALKGLAKLRAALPPDISIWAGGNGVSGIRKQLRGTAVAMTLDSAISQLDGWRA